MRNCGFVNCEWKITGTLRQNDQSKIFAEGRTFDNKFYTFKECDYSTTWKELQVKILPLSSKSTQNLDESSISILESAKVGAAVP